LKKFGSSSPSGFLQKPYRLVDLVAALGKVKGE